MIDVIIAGIIGFLFGGFFGVFLMALMVGCRRDDEE